MTSGKKTAIVTGGLSGIGLAIARRLAADGMTVVVGARSAGKEVHVNKVLGADAKHIHAAALDVQSRDSVDAFVAEVVKAQGGVDILVNAAGVYKESAMIDHPEQIWDDHLNTNLLRVQSGAFGLGPLCQPRGSGAWHYMCFDQPDLGRNRDAQTLYQCRYAGQWPDLGAGPRRIRQVKSAKPACSAFRSCGTGSVSG